MTTGAQWASVTVTWIVLPSIRVHNSFLPWSSTIKAGSSPSDQRPYARWMKLSFPDSHRFALRKGASALEEVIGLLTSAIPLYLDLFSKSEDRETGGNRTLDYLISAMPTVIEAIPQSRARVLAGSLGAELLESYTAVPQNSFEQFSKYAGETVKCIAYWELWNSFHNCGAP